MDTKPLDEKANQLLSYANIIAIGLWKPFEDKCPNLIEKITGNKHFKWDFYIKIAILWCAISDLKIQLPESKFDDFFKIIEQRLINWHPQSLAAIKDINNFLASYKNKLKQPNSLEEALQFTKLLVGTWVIWNLTDKAKMQDEAEISGAIGQAIYDSIKGYWTK